MKSKKTLTAVRLAMHYRAVEMHLAGLRGCADRIVRRLSSLDTDKPLEPSDLGDASVHFVGMSYEMTRAVALQFSATKTELELAKAIYAYVRGRITPEELDDRYRAFHKSPRRHKDGVVPGGGQARPAEPTGEQARLGVCEPNKGDGA